MIRCCSDFFSFSPDSFVVTGNDNSDWFYDWEEDFDGSETAKKVDVFLQGELIMIKIRRNVFETNSSMTHSLGADE